MYRKRGSSSDEVDVGIASKCTFWYLCSVCYKAYSCAETFVNHRIDAHGLQIPNKEDYEDNGDLGKLPKRRKRLVPQAPTKGKMKPASESFPSIKNAFQPKAQETFQDKTQRRGQPSVIFFKKCSENELLKKVLMSNFMKDNNLITPPPRKNSPPHKINILPHHFKRKANSMELRRIIQEFQNQHRMDIDEKVNEKDEPCLVINSKQPAQSASTFRKVNGVDFQDRSKPKSLEEHSVINAQLSLSVEEASGLVNRKGKTEIPIQSHANASNEEEEEEATTFNYDMLQLKFHSNIKVNKHYKEQPPQMFKITTCIQRTLGMG